MADGRFALVDAAVACDVSRWSWFKDSDYTSAMIPSADGPRRKLSMHRYIWMLMGREPTPEIDHADGDGINNRIENLRPATHRENCWNRGAFARTSDGPKGVYKRDGRWRAGIRVHGRLKWLGTFASAVEAAAVYDGAARAAFGEFARARGCEP